jgi:hypothetical protein
MVRAWSYFLRLACLATLVLACGQDKQARTELLLVADTDISDLDTIRFEITQGDRSESEEGIPRSDGEPLTLGVVLAGDSLGPIAVSAHGIRAGQTVVERSAVVSFVKGKTLVVELHLVESCESRRCLLWQTCTESGCESNRLDEDELNEWTGSTPSLGGTLLSDAGSREAGVDGGVLSEGGNGEITTCGVDVDVDLSSDIDHCGDCKTSCKASGRNTVATCVAGACGEECRPLYGDCDGNATNGCEQSLSMSMNCGECGMRCATGSSCFLGSCR